MLKVTLSVVALMLIAGCVTSPSANEIRILNREGNVVSGMAGIWWTDKRLKSNPSGVICGGAGEVVANTYGD